MSKRDAAVRTNHAFRRAALLASASVVALSLMSVAGHARNLMQGAAASNAATAAAGSAQIGAAQAAAAAQRAQRSIANATNLIRQNLTNQLSARNRALATPSGVADGLVSGGLVPDNVATWSGLRAPTQTGAATNPTVTIEQTAASAIANWSSFNVGRNTILYFDQRGGNSPTGNSWAVLNRVTDPSAAPSQILGQIRAEGLVLVINRNGIIFGGSSQVNVGSLVASTLGITDAQFRTGIVNQQAFNTATNLANPAIFANTPGATGDVTVEAGAMIQTAAPASVTAGGGSVFLFGANVTNNGVIYTPNGQVVLAAGTAAYVTASIEPGVRGVQVIVENGGESGNTGYIGAPTGNISMYGMMVRQSGVLAASTSVNEAGSITLLAGDGLYTESTNHEVHVKRTGTVELSAGSLSAVLPEEDGLTASIGQPQPQSLIRLEGETVKLLGGSSIWAPGAKVSLNASSNPANLYALDYAPSLVSSSAADAGRVYIGDGALIDVAGLKLVPIAAAESAAKVNARGNEFRDSPLQRDGILAGKDVWIDVRGLITVAADRVYTPGGLLEVSGYLGLAQRNIDQRLTAAGSVNIFSTGDAIVRPGAVIDISGGSLIHQAGYVDGTRLVGADGRLYDINQAPADVVYAGVCCDFRVKHARWGIEEVYTSRQSAHYQSEYIEGTAAGAISLTARSAEFDASVNAATVSGVYQRTAQSQPAGGSLTIGSVAGAGMLIQPNAVVIAATVPAPDDVFANSTVTGAFRDFPTPVLPSRVRDPNTLLSADRQQTLYLSADLLDQAGYGTININSQTGGIRVASGAELQAAPRGAINLTSTGRIAIDGNLTARAGAVTLKSGTSAAAADIVLSAGAAIDTRGLWVNDLLDGADATPALYDGGNVSLLASGNVTVGQGAMIDASSGGWVQANGRMKMSGDLPVGRGGDITLVADAFVRFNTFSSNTTTGVITNVPTNYPFIVTLNGSIRSYGFSRGGALSIATPKIQIGGGAAPAGVMQLDASFFTSGGFGRYALYGYQGVTIAAGADIQLHATTYGAVADAERSPTGTDVSTIAVPTPTPSFRRPAPVDLILSAIDPFAGDLVMQQGASIHGEVGATIGLHATHQLTMDGVISAPAGSINIDLYGAPAPSDVGAVPPSNPTAFAAPDFDPKQTLWIGPHARLLAQGVVETYVDANGRIRNVIRGGGTVNINQDALHALYYPYANYERTMNAPLGTVVAEAGAVIDVSGVSGTILLPSRTGLRGIGTSAFDISTDGGAINIRASQGLLWAATMNARGGGAAAAGGSLSIDQVGWGQPSNATNRLREPDYVVPVFQLVISQAGTWMAPGLRLGDAVPSGLQGQMFIGVDQIEASGATSISLGGVDAVVFKGDVTLNAGNRLTLNARNFSATPGATVVLNAPYVDIGSGQRTGTWVGDNNYIGQSTPGAVAGTAKLVVNANLIDIEGDLRSGAGYSYTSRYNGATAVSTAVSLPGFASMSFNSSGDIRLVTQLANNSTAGQLLTLGDINFTAAQVYPTTGAASSSNTAFTIKATGPTSTITFARNSAETPPVPLSANGQLVIIAPTINQGGVLRAPMGQITFGDAANPSFSKVNLLPGSITSVSLEGSLIPYGQPAGALAYIYGYAGSTPNELQTTTTPQPPSKQISFFGSTVNVAGGNGEKPAAVINESGGGDLYGAQFVSGRQGSVDTLAGTQTFAILPSLGSAYAPRDPQMQRSDGGTNVDGTPVNLKVGDQVYLNGINGLPAGYYTLLPGHYALLPGGYKVTVAASQVAPTMLQDSAMPGGAYMVSGYRANANTGQRDQLGSQFLVTPGDVVRKLSQYDETTISQFFQKQAAAQNLAPPALAQDAGRLVIQVTSALIFQGRGDFSVGVGGRGGQADIVGTNLVVLGDGDVAPTGFVGLTDTSLNAIGAQSLLIGGLRNTPFSNRNQITITPSAAAIEIGGHARLAAPEIMLVASGTITLDPGAQIDTTPFGAIADRFPTDPATGLSLGQIVISTTSGAFLMASNATPLSVSRTSVTASTSSLIIGAGAGVYARSSLILNDTNTMSINPTARFAAPTVNAGAAIINVGSGASSGFTITDELLKVLSQGDASRGLGPTTNLILSASQSINLYGPASLGTVDPVTGEYSVAGLTLNAPLIQGIGTAGDVARIAAGNVTLQGATTAGTGSVAGQGTLQIESANLTLGPGALNLAGFGTVTLTGTAQVAGKGIGVIGVAGDLTVATSRLTGNAKADTTLNATGAVKLNRSAQASGTATPVNSLGAHLTVIGQTIEQNTDIEIASGVVNLTGSAGVTLDAGSIINVAGGATTFFDVVRIAPGGTVNLTAQSGNVDIQSGAIVDVSGTARTETAGIDPLSSDKGGDAGALNIVATNGTAILGGIFNTGTVDGYKGAQVSLDLGSGNAGVLLAAIADFSEKQALTLRTGDMTVGNLTAHDVELSATSGNLTVVGSINASGANGGIIRLAAGLGKNLTIAGTAVLDAHATSASGTSASVFLGTGVSDTVTSGRVLLASGATIDVSGGLGNGKVTIRAPRVGSSLVGVSDGGVIVTGAREIDVEAVAVTDITANPFVDQALVAADAAAQAYMANAAAIKAGIGSLATSNVFHLMAGIELRSTGDMTLMQNPTSANPGIDLHNLRYNGEAAVLTLRAAGNLTINASLSDGFVGPEPVKGNDQVTGGRNGAVYALAAQLPAGSRSWSLRLVGGADLAGADPLALLDKSALASGKGSIIFNDPRLDQKGFPIPSVVRTGTGDLDLAAAADISLLSQFGIYTAGTAGSPASSPSGFTAPVRPFIMTAPAKGPNSILGYSAAATTTDSNFNFDKTYPTAFTPNYPENGGNLTVRAKGNLTSAAISPPAIAPGNNSKTLYGGSEIDTFWLWTQETPVGGVISNGTWYINFGAYYQAFAGGSNPNLPTTGSPRVAAFVGLGALGGGNAKVSVGGDMTNVDVAVPTTGRLPGRDLSRLVVTGGGNLDVAVGGAINNANILVGRGVATVRAADIGSTSIVNLIPGDAQLSAYADRNINVAIGDPTRMGAIGQTVAGSTPIGLEGVTSANFQGSSSALPYGYFTSYTERTAFNTFAAGGDIFLSGSYGPPIMEVVAPNGSINGTTSLGTGTTGFHTLPGLPAATAQLDFLAGRNINAAGVSMTGVNVAIETAPPTYAAVGTILNFTELTTGATPSNLVQFDDPRTVHIYAVAGDIVQPAFATSKRTNVRAGRDIVAPLLYLQNSDRDADAVDVSTIQAGRDITSYVSSLTHAFNIRMGGPGYLEVQAGRDLFVSSSANGNSRGTGIATIGNAENNLLPKVGAAIGVSVGVGATGPRNAAFIDAYLDPATAGATAALYAFDLIDYVHRQRPALTNLAVNADEFNELTPAQQGALVQLALSEFEKMPPAWQAPLIQKVYFAEIKAGGQTAAAGDGAGGKGFDRAYKAIQTLFPGTTIGTKTTAYDGNLSLYQLARIRTEAGGDINLLVPGGDIVLGFENQTPNLAGQKDTARPGLLTLRGGGINTFSDGDAIVAQSRVFTELGGDIVMWSTNADVNAGKGKKTSLVTSPPQFTLDPYANVTKSPSTPQTGAGIAALQGVPGVKQGDVFLFAPHGTVDAGDASIRGNDVTIGALFVLNADNIQAAGRTVGIPTAPPPNVTALTAADNAAGAAAKAMEGTKPGDSNQNNPSVIIVEVLGYGGGDGDPDDRSRLQPDQRSYNAADPIRIVGYGPLGQQETQGLTAEEQQKLSRQ